MDFSFSKSSTLKKGRKGDNSMENSKEYEKAIHRKTWRVKKYIKRCSSILEIIEMKIESIILYPQIGKSVKLIIFIVSKDLGNRVLS